MPILRADASIIEQVAFHQKKGWADGSEDCGALCVHATSCAPPKIACSALLAGLHLGTPSISLLYPSVLCGVCEEPDEVKEWQEAGSRFFFMTCHNGIIPRNNKTGWSSNRVTTWIFVCIRAVKDVEVWMWTDGRTSDGHFGWNGGEGRGRRQRHRQRRRSGIYRHLAQLQPREEGISLRKLGIKCCPIASRI